MLHLLPYKLGYLPLSYTHDMIKEKRPLSYIPSAFTSGSTFICPIGYRLETNWHYQVQILLFCSPSEEKQQTISIKYKNTNKVWESYGRNIIDIRSNERLQIYSIAWEEKNLRMRNLKRAFKIIQLVFFSIKDHKEEKELGRSSKLLEFLRVSKRLSPLQFIKPPHRPMNFKELQIY